MSTSLLGPMIITRSRYWPGTSRTDECAGLFFDISNTIGGSTTESWSPHVSSASSLYRGGIQYHLFYKSTTAPTANKFLAGGPSGSTVLNIYKGVRPPISTLTNLSSHSSNLLISFPIPAYSTNRATTGMFFDQSAAIASNSVISKTVDFPGVTAYLGISPSFVSAAASGTATWFWFGNYATPTDLTGKSFVTGTVGITGSGSDLEISNTSIEANELYKSMGFKFYIPAVQS